MTTEDQFRAVFDTIDQGFCIIEIIFENEKPVDYRYIEINPAFEKHAGRGNVLGKTVRELVPEPDQKWFDFFGEIVITGQSQRFEQYFASTQRWLDVFATRLGDAKNKKLAVVFSDISLRKKSEEELRQSKERKDLLTQKLQTAKDQLEATFQGIPAAIYQFNSHGKVIYLNQQGAELMGYDSPEELIAETNQDTIRQHVDKKYTILDENGEILPTHKSSFAIAFRTGEKNELITQFINKQDGSSAWMLSSSTPITNKEGKLVFVLTLVTNITEHIMARKEIEVRELRFRTLAETLPQMIWVRNVEGKIEYGSRNWEEYSGIKNISEAWRTMTHPDDWDQIMKAWEISTSTGQPLRYEVRLKNKAGIYRWHSAVGEPVRNDRNEITTWIGALTDIHDQKIFTNQLEQLVAERTDELVKLNKELESFNFVASHDLQEPLRKIRTFIDRILNNRTDKESMEKFLVKIDESASRMHELIQSILEYSALSGTKSNHTKVDLEEIMIEVKGDLEIMIEEKNAIVITDKLPVIMANAPQMNQLFLNLLSNSLKFSKEKEKPKITITVKTVTGNTIKSEIPFRTEQKFIQLTFTDNGIGFDSMYKDQVFAPFKRLHRSDEYPGTGIGLSIVKKIVEQHQGHIIANSEPGKGTEFNIWLPA